MLEWTKEGRELHDPLRDSCARLQSTIFRDGDATLNVTDFNYYKYAMTRRGFICAPKLSGPLAESVASKDAAAAVADVTPLANALQNTAYAAPLQGSG